MLVIAAAAASCAFGASPARSSPSTDSSRDVIENLNRVPELAPFVSTPMEVVQAMLELAEVTGNDVLYDLGSGDGRIVITAAKQYGARAVGFEIDPALVQESRENVRDAGVDHLVEIRQQDALGADFSQATVVTLYLFPDANLMLRPLLQRQLRVGARVVSSQFDMGDWQADDFVDIQVRPVDSDGEHDGDEDVLLRGPEEESYTLYLWRISREKPS